MPARPLHQADLDAQAPFVLNEFVIEGRFVDALLELATGKAMTDEDYPLWIEGSTPASRIGCSKSIL